MSLRDIVLFGAFAVLVPMMLRHPYIGALTWVLFGVMNPHRLTWGAAYHFPFALLIAVITVVGLVFTREHRAWKGGAAGVVLVMFVIWIGFANLFSFHPDQAVVYLERVIKIFLMTGVLLLLLHTRRHVDLLVWMLVISLGFYGAKGGLFVLATGGHFLVNGPEGSVMEGNNSLAVGLVMVIPLMYYLYQVNTAKWMRLGLLGGMGLCAISVLGSYSRGALLAIGCMGLVMWVRGKHKLSILAVFILFALIALPMMPDQWMGRMQTIQTYEEDASASNRLIAWETALNIAKDRFPLAGGFEWEGPDTSARYSPVPTMSLVAHSIYFEVIGSVGFVGIALFLTFWMLVWRQCSWIRSRARAHADLRWAYTLASMIQVSFVGYAVGGAFLNLAFWDLPYYLFAVTGTTLYVVKETLNWDAQGNTKGTSTGVRGRALPRPGMAGKRAMRSP